MLGPLRGGDFFLTHTVELCYRE